MIKSPIASGTNNLNIFRRHLAHCRRYSELSKKPFTYWPATSGDRRADCRDCSVWCLGYLARETHVVHGQIRPKRIFVSLGTNDWTAAEMEFARLYERGLLPPVEVGASMLDPDAITVPQAGKRYLESRTGASLDPIEKDTLDHYASLIEQRLFPYCELNGIHFIRDFENRDVCSRFTESWRQLRRGVGEFLAMSTRKTEMQRFRTFLRFGVENGWLAKSGTDTIRTKRRTTAQQEERHGLELTEYQQILAAPDSPDLTRQENAETRAVTELMRWSGLRISDAHKFNDSELVFNERGDGWNVDFIQKKTKKRCICPVSDHVLEMLQALPGRLEGGKKYLFTCSYTALRERVSTLAARAQREKPFSHVFSPHCLHHTFAIQHFHEGTPVELVSKWLGHESTAVTVKHYQNWIGSTRQVAEKVSRDANAGMLAKAVALQIGHTQTGRSLPPRPSEPGIVSRS